MSNSLEQVISNYKHGKELLGKRKSAILKDLEDSHSEINELSKYYDESLVYVMLSFFHVHILYPHQFSLIRF